MLTPLRNQSLLEIDPDLGAGLESDDFEHARARLFTPLLRLEQETLSGKWGTGSPDLAGLIVVEGALLRQIATAGRETAELIGPGDLIRPFQEDGEEDLPVRTSITWQRIGEVAVAVIDVRVLILAAEWPSILAALLARAIRRSQRQAVNMSISHLVRVSDRLLLLFWHLSHSWGRVTPDGVVLDLPLTHAQLALLVGAERPSVSTALGKLADEQLVTRLPSRGWRLSGPMPDELDSLLAGSAE